MLPLITNTTSGDFKFNIITKDQNDLSYVKATLDGVVTQIESYDTFHYENLYKNSFHTLKLQPIDFVGNVGNEITHTWYITEDDIEINLEIPTLTSASATYITVSSTVPDLFKLVDEKYGQAYIKYTTQGFIDDYAYWGVGDTVDILRTEDPAVSIGAGGITRSISVSATINLATSTISADNYTYTASGEWIYDNYKGGTPSLIVLEYSSGNIIFNPTLSSPEYTYTDCEFDYKITKNSGSSSIVVYPYSGNYEPAGSTSFNLSVGEYTVHIKARTPAGNIQTNISTSNITVV